MSVALALTLLTQAPVEQVDFTQPARVTGLPRRAGPEGCELRFEFEDPDLGWVPWHHGLTAPAGVSEPLLFVPPAGWALDEDLAWRIVDGRGRVVTVFDGIYAVNARPLARRMGALPALRQGRASAACAAASAPGRSCWTAFELWVFMEEHAEGRCQSL